jgi:sulfur-carrier protein adenylyltransferase/sulfurtransferase
MSLSTDELRHYSRHLLLEEVGKEGQEKLKSSKVLLIGAGGLGCPAALYLGAAGVGTLGIIDFDVVDVSNLQRQIAFTYEDIGHSKAEKIRERILAGNPHIEVKVYKERFSIENARDLFEEYDVVVDGCDNFGTRYLSNDTAFFTNTPLIFGAIHRFQGQMSVFNGSEDSPCYRCLFPNPPDAGSIPNCAEAGVLGVLPGVVGVIQATEAVKEILGNGTSLRGRLMVYDALRMNFSEFKLAKNPNCPLCGENPEITELAEIELLCPSQSAAAENIAELSPQDLSDKMKSDEDFLLIDVREEYEWEICHIEGAKLIPLRMIKDVEKTLAKDKDLVLYCHHGMRSLSALETLRSCGFSRLLNLTGGIAAWGDEIDPEMPQY